MSDTSRKRSRKSKLVPRECTINDDIEVQVPVFKIKNETPIDILKKSKLVLQECTADDVVETQRPIFEVLEIKKENQKIILKPLSIDKNETSNRDILKQSNLVPQEVTVDDDVEAQNLTFENFKDNILKIKKDTQEMIPKPLSLDKLESCNMDILKRLSAQVSDMPEPAPSIKFDIQVEVEQCDDDDNVEMTNEVSEDTQINKPVRRVVVTYKNTKKTGQNQNLPPCILLTETKILQAADEILEHSTNPADRILDIGVRNTIGHERKGTMYTNKHEALVQDKLDEWKVWESKSFYRESPLLYKCYVCEKAWWYLSEFRNHISEHPSIDIALEFYGKHEINLIAFFGKKPEMKDIYAAGFCHKCGKDFHAHKLSSLYQNKYYKNKGCNKVFFNCIGRRNHMATCDECNVGYKQFQCQICKSKFDAEDILNGHLGLCHAVRSDIPILSRCTTCEECSGRYNLLDLHICKRSSQTQCIYCFQSFANKSLCELHMENSCEPYTCNICGQVLLWNCQVFEHMMRHSDKYTLVRKCVICNEFKVFLNNDAATEHRHLGHPQKDTQRNQFIVKILVPKSCLEEPYLIPEPESETTSLLRSGTQAVQKLELEQGYENIVIKEELLDIDDNPLQFVIKEEIQDPDENIEENTFEHNTNTFTTDIQIKQEHNENEYEEDIIKLNIDMNNGLLIPKQEIESQNQEYINYENSEYSVSVKEESMFEPEVILNQKTRQRKKMYKCGRCGFKALHKDYKDHIENECIRSSSDHPYFCTKCDKEFLCMKKYLGHFVNHGYDCLSCPDCLTKYYSFTKLIPHVQYHIKHMFVRVKSITQDGTKLMPEYQCKKCSEVVAASLFFDHWELHVQSSPEKAVAQLRTKAKYHRHQGAQEELIKESLKCLQQHVKQCNQCDRKFNRINECKRHIIEHLLTDAYNHKHESGELICQKCGLGFLTPEKYKQHMRDHASLPVYRCELCDRTFSDSSNFTKHKKVHNLKVFICDLCKKKFQSKFTLEKHVAMHAHTKPIPCLICNKEFFFETNYRRHVRYFHEKVSIGFRCVICNERFSSLKFKWNHMWEVHKERKQKADCPICFKSFRKYTDVRVHARIEHKTEVSVYSCKNATKKSTKTVSDIQNYLKNNTNTNIKIGKRETLVVFE